MIRRPFPAARRLDDAVRAGACAKIGGRPHMVEPAAAVRRQPVPRAIAPPGIERLGRGDEMAAEHAPVPLRLQTRQRTDLQRRVTDALAPRLKCPPATCPGTTWPT